MNIKWLVLVVLGIGLTYASPKMVVNVDCMGDSCEHSDRITTVADLFEDDYLYLGNELIFSGEAQDLVFIGKNLTVNGNTRLGFMGAGKKLIFSGTTGNGLLAAGGAIVVEGKIVGNNYLACKSFQLTDKATIDGNLFLACAKGTLEGTLNGDVHCASGELVVNGVVNGNATVYSGRIIFGNEGKINGNLTYGSKEKLRESDIARVTGIITVDEKHAFKSDSIFPAQARRVIGFIAGAAFCLSFVIIGCLVLLIPAFRNLRITTANREFWNSALRGLVPLLMYPAAIVLSFILVVTIPFGFILLSAGIPLLFFACIIGTTLAGAYISAKFNWRVQKRHWHFLIGGAAGAVLSAIPGINFLWFVLVSALGWSVYLRLLGTVKTTNNPLTTPATGGTA